MDARRVVGVALAAVLLLLAGYGYSQRAGLQRPGTELGHWLYDAAAWPAENLSRLDTRSLLPSMPAQRTTQGPAAGKVTRFISWQRWLKVPSDTRFRQLQARTPHARTVRTIVTCEILLPPGLVLLLLVWRWCSGGPLGRLKPSTAMGSARWATAREIRALRPRGDGLGFVLGYAGRRLVSLPEKVLYQNVMLIGPPGVRYSRPKPIIDTSTSRTAPATHQSHRRL